jgi:predicted protein tyrosine phosphatase
MVKKMNKRKFDVKAISVLLTHVDAYLSREQRKDIAVILITTKTYEYDFGDIPVLILSFLDVAVNQPGFICFDDVQKIRGFLPVIKEKKKVYIGCDQGMNRSPAVAMALSDHLDLPFDKNYLKRTYKNPNLDVYEFIKMNL